MSGERPPEIALVGLRAAPGRGFRLVCLLILASLIVAVWKPWAGSPTQGGAPPEGASPTGMLGQQSSSPGRAEAPTPGAAGPTLAPDGQLPACYAGFAWSVFALVRDLQYRSREWMAVEPMANATGPSDPTIPVIPIADQQVMAVGFCTDYATNPGRLISQTGFWRLEARGPRRLTPILAGDLTPEDPAMGIILGPPPPFVTGSGEALSWAAGRYVFELSVRGESAPTGDLWFAIQIIRSCPTGSTPPRSGLRPSATPNASPGAGTC